MNTIPLFSIAIAYIIGIVLARYIHIGIGWIYGVCLSMLCLSIISSRGKNYFLLLTALMIGWLFYSLDAHLPQEVLPLPANHISHFTGYKRTIIGSIIDHPQTYGGNASGYGRTRFTLEAESIAAQDVNEVFGSKDPLCHKLCGKLLVTLPWIDNNLKYGDKILLTGELQKPFSLKNPGGFDYRQHLAHQKILVTCWIRGENGIKRIGYGRVNPIITFSAMIKDYAVGSIYQLLPEPASYFLDGVILGNRTQLPEHMQEWFADTGTLHVLAVSGMNVALVVITFFFFFRLFRMNKRLAYLLNIPVVIVFCLVTGCVPSVLRASLMAIIFLISRNLLERDVNIYHVIGLAALICLVPCPQMVFDLSFQLSFLAVLGIVYLAPIISDRLLFFLPRWLSLTIATTLGAQLSTTPLLSYSFHKMSLISLASNAIVVPLVGLITPLGLISFGLNMISYKLAWLVAYLNSLLITLLLICVEFFASIPYACIPVASPSFMDIALYYLVLITIRHVDKTGWRNAGLICLIAANLFFWEQVSINKDRTGLTVTFLDIEKGSAAFLEFEDSKKMLININAKEWDMKYIVLPFLQGRGVKTIDVVIGDTVALDKKIKIGLKLGKDIPSGRITGFRMGHIITSSRGISIDYGQERGEKGVRFLFPFFPLSKTVREFSDSSGKQIILNLPTRKIATELQHKVNAGVVVVNKGCNWQDNKGSHVVKIEEKGAVIVTTDGEDVSVRGCADE
ncbi:MAG: ComEC/Rec2 family competence protein [bacterium]|nr:ComEC/Rec2 family competence protein [bacterium]